jgi:2-polyprenyl-3-methyl-5-hydroxy-6-metoxy-1,4-benzoquinol methylase
MKDLHSAYNAWHDGLPVDATADTPWHHMIRSSLDVYRDLAGKRILEIGCGRGGFACWLISTFPQIAEMIAADFSEVAIQKGRAFGACLPVTWSVENIQEMSYQDASFDTVISCETIEHVPDPSKAVSELSRVLRPGGRLFLTTPNYFNLSGLHRIYGWIRGRTFREEGQPINQVTLLPRVRRWVRRAGLQVLHVNSVNHILPWPRRSGGICLKWPRAIPYVFKWFGSNSFILAEKPHP